MGREGEPSTTAFEHSRPHSFEPAKRG